MTDEAFQTWATWQARVKRDVAAERERCARIAEQWHHGDTTSDPGTQIAARIRSGE